MHAPTQERSDDSKDSFYEELERVFHHLKILLGDFNQIEKNVMGGACSSYGGGEGCIQGFGGES